MQAHNGTVLLVCPFCLKKFHGETRSWTLAAKTQEFCAHIVRHSQQMKATRCASCKLMFIHDGKLDERRGHQHPRLEESWVKGKAEGLF